MKIIKELIALLIYTYMLAACATTQSVAANPRAAVYNTDLGLAYLQQGNIPRAKAKLLLAKQQDVHSPTVWDAVALLDESTGDLQQAKLDYQQALKLAPKQGQVLNNYGAFLCRHGQYVTALPYFTQASQDPAYLNVAMALENAGLCAKQIPDYAVAKQYFTRALQIDPHLPLATAELSEINEI